MALLGGPNIIDSGLIVALDAANSNSSVGSGINWYDLSGNSRTGTLFNSPTYYSNYINFDGTNDFAIPGGAGNLYAWTADGSVGNSLFTYDIWVRTSDGSGYIISKPWNGSGRYNMLINAGGFGLLVGTGTPSGNDQSYSISYTVDIDTGNWTNLVVWANTSQMGYYINGGQYSGSVTHGLTGGASDFGNAGLPLTLMTLYPYGEGWGGNTGFSVAGDVGAFKAYNRQLSVTEVTQNYNATKGRFGL
jgi:hypothetical protein